MTREGLAIKIQNEKRSRGLSWKKIAEGIALAPQFFTQRLSLGR